MNVIFVTCLACADLVLVSESLISILEQFKVIITCSSQAFTTTLATTGFTSMLSYHSSMGTKTKKKAGTDLGCTGVVDSFYFNDTYYDC